MIIKEPEAKPREEPKPRDKPPTPEELEARIEVLEGQMTLLSARVISLSALIDQLNWQITTAERQDSRNTILTNQPAQLQTPNGPWP